MRDYETQKILVTVDIVVFSVIKRELSVLLIKRGIDPFRGKLAIPGGFVKTDEELEHAARRELEEETGVADIFLHRLGAYGDVGRDPRGRVVTIVFLALIDAERFMLDAKTDALEAQWVPVNEAHDLAFDHSLILKDAQKDLRLEVQTTNMAAQILPERFTLTELQRLYENILGRALDKRNFRKRVASFGILKGTKETKMEGRHRPARLFRFREREYRPLKEKIHVFT